MLVPKRLCLVVSSRSVRRQLLREAIVTRIAENAVKAATETNKNAIRRTENATRIGGKRFEQQRLQLEEQRLQHEQQLEKQRKQREFDERKWREERAYKDSTAVKIKTRGDALRNTITKMPSEGIDVVSWFVSVDKLFEQLSVPADLQAILIRPYLSDRAKRMMSKFDPAHSAKYENVNSFLIKEYTYLQQYIWRSLIL